MTIEKIRTKQGAHPIKDYPFSRDGEAWRCSVCGKIWLKESRALKHLCQPEDDDEQEISPSR